MSSARYFIPVCLYPHTKYRTSVGVSDLFDKYQLHGHEYLIVIADRLLVLDRLVTGRYWTVDSASAKARQEAEEIARLIQRIAYKTKAQAKGRIVFWDEIADSQRFAAFAPRLRDAVSSDHLLRTAIEEFAKRRVQRFGLGSAPDAELAYEWEYLLSEVCMSVFCTEVLQFSVEVWERPPAPDIPDPLKLLYDHRAELVERLTGRTAQRSLSFLYGHVHHESSEGMQGALAEN